MNALSNLSHNPMYEEGDYIKFKHFTTFDTHNDTNNMTWKGKIIDCSNPDLLEVVPVSKDANNDTNSIILINPTSILKHYPCSTVRHPSIRLLLKEIWKDFIFREVKTIKTKDPY